MSQRHTHQVRRRKLAWIRVERLMFDRLLMGELALAALLAVPTLALAGAPSSGHAAANPLVQRAAVAESLHAERRTTVRLG